MNEEVKKVRVTITDPETRDAITYEFADMQAAMEWLAEEIKKEKTETNENAEVA